MWFVPSSWRSRHEEELPGESGDLLGQRATTGTVCAFGDENRLLNAAGLGLPELRFQHRRDFVAKEECGLAYSPIEAGGPQPICGNSHGMYHRIRRA